MRLLPDASTSTSTSTCACASASTRPLGLPSARRSQHVISHVTLSPVCVAAWPATAQTAVALATRPIHRQHHYNHYHHYHRRRRRRHCDYHYSDMHMQDDSLHPSWPPPRRDHGSMCQYTSRRCSGAAASRNHMRTWSPTHLVVSPQCKVQPCPVAGANQRHVILSGTAAS